MCRYPNVIILTTSNITGAIDLAFVDRADVKQYLGPPSPRAIYQIFYSAINELIRVSCVDNIGVKVLNATFFCLFMFVALLRTSFVYNERIFFN